MKFERPLNVPISLDILVILGRHSIPDHDEMKADVNSDLD